MKNSKNSNKMMHTATIHISRQFLCRASLLALLPLLLMLTSSVHTALAVEDPATLGTEDTAVGTGALAHEQAGGNYNSAFGYTALFSNTLGIRNTAMGVNALYSNVTGTDNAATGLNALYSNIIGSNNTATGNYSLAFNTSGIQNTAIGWSALYSNSSGKYNTATGLGALHENIQGNNNTATGINVLYHNTGSSNAAFGANALITNDSGHNNTASGFNALNNNTSGSSNTALGSSAGSNLTTGNGNVCIGANVFGVAGDNNTTWIKNVYASVASGRAVYVNADNKIGTLASSRRYKEEIKPINEASETLFSLKPVTFRYKKEIDPSRSRCFGLIAEEVAQVDPELVTPDGEGKPETVRYEAVNAMLLNEFLKEHRKVEQQAGTIAQLKSALTQQGQDLKSIITRQQKQIEAIASDLQKVSAQVRLSRPEPHVVDNRH
jgi:trimeric autotransporter adhesin